MQEEGVKNVMAINSKDKGRKGELSLVHFLKDLGFECHRSQQFKGDTSGDDDADVVGIPYIHIECKRNEKLNVEKALQQAERDNSKDDIIPVVMWRKNRETWKATLRLDKFMEIFRVYMEERQKDEQS